MTADWDHELLLVFALHIPLQLKADKQEQSSRPLPFLHNYFLFNEHMNKKAGTQGKVTTPLHRNTGEGFNNNTGYLFKWFSVPGLWFLKLPKDYAYLTFYDFAGEPEGLGFKGSLSEGV